MQLMAQIGLDTSGLIILLITCGFLVLLGSLVYLAIKSMK